MARPETDQAIEGKPEVGITKLIDHLRTETESTKSRGGYFLQFLYQDGGQANVIAFLKRLGEPHFRFTPREQDMLDSVSLTKVGPPDTANLAAAINGHEISVGITRRELIKRAAVVGLSTGLPIGTAVAHAGTTEEEKTQEQAGQQGAEEGAKNSAVARLKKGGAAAAVVGGLAAASDAAFSAYIEVVKLHIDLQRSDIEKLIAQVDKVVEVGIAERRASGEGISAR
jgi:hypothetical protein